MTELDALNKVIELLGGQERLAEKTGFSQSAISHMKKSGRASPKAAPLFERAVQGRVTCEELRPDLYSFNQAP